MSNTFKLQVGRLFTDRIENMTWTSILIRGVRFLSWHKLDWHSQLELKCENSFCENKLVIVILQPYSRKFAVQIYVQILLFQITAETILSAVRKSGKIMPRDPIETVARSIEMLWKCMARNINLQWSLLYISNTNWQNKVTYNSW